MASVNPVDDEFKTGFPKEIINGGNIDPKYLCSLCELVLRAPIQSFCGHRFCEACIKHLLENVSEDQQLMCPSCEKEETENEFSDLKKTFPDNAIKREFANMTAKCVNGGCTWEGPFKQYLQHENVCEHQLLKCECGERILKCQFEDHRQNQCPNRMFICPFCNAHIMAKLLEGHNNVCPMFPMKCSGCGREGMMRTQLLRHQDSETGDCEARDKICPLNCGRTVEGDLKSHMQEAAGDHIIVLTEVMQRLDTKIKSVFNEGVIVADAVATPPVASSSDVEKLYRMVNDLENQLTTVTQSEKFQITLGEQNAGSRTLPVDGASGGITQNHSFQRGQPDGDDVVHKIKVTDTKVVQFEDTLAIITQQLDSFREEADQLLEQNREMRTTVEEQGRKIKNLEKSIQLKDLSLAEADLKIQALEQTAYDGVMTWKITDFAKKRQDAIAGRMSSVYSPPFYTNRTGYKMCARLYLNGDGMGKGTHLSLFFVVMKGTYDALLKWPFRQKVTLMLLDQNNCEHVMEAFRPDPNSSSFRRPTSDMNIASGCPLFCQLSQIEQTLPAYLKDDTMFIKIIVNTTDL